MAHVFTCDLLRSPLTPCLSLSVCVQLSLRVKALKRQVDESEGEVERLEGVRRKVLRDLEEQQELQEALHAKVTMLETELKYVFCPNYIKQCWFLEVFQSRKNQFIVPQTLFNPQCLTSDHISDMCRLHTRWHSIVGNWRHVRVDSGVEELSQCFLIFLLFASHQEEVAADTSCSSGLLHFKLGGWGRFLWHQHHLHPERDPPTDLQLLKEDDGMNEETYKKLFFCFFFLSSSADSYTCKVLSDKGTQGIKDLVAMHYKFALQSWCYF